MAPLDWGLGHATRCVPMIRSLLAGGFEVILAAEKSGAMLLQKEFPSLTILPLRGYNIRYSKNKNLFFLKMILQVPKILAIIRSERTWLKTVIKKQHIDIVISDNRFGLSNKKVHCIFITHQLFIKTGNRITEKIARQINYRYINNFNECWVPDEAGENNLAGELSHPKKMPLVPVKYIGPVSRFTKRITEKNTDLLVLVSGPEPQRTFFENILLAQIKGYYKKTVVVRGLPGTAGNIPEETENLSVFNHLPAEELNKLILSAKTIVAVSGYSTVMDLAVLQQKAVLVPTPGQVEQEYLGQYLARKKYFVVHDREGFDLQKAIQDLEAGGLIAFPNTGTDLLRDAVNSL